MNLPTLARVTSVTTENGQVYVDVEEARPGSGGTGIPFASLAPGFMITPKEGYWVEVYKTEDGKQARFSHSSPMFDMPDLSEDSFAYRFNDGTEFSAVKQDDGTYKVTVKGDGKVTLESDTGVTIDGETVDLGSGTKGVITDIETTTDSDGHVTGIEVTRSSKINVE